MDVKQIEKIAQLIKSFKGNNSPRIIFLNGAGISTSCGIPDFRTPGTGLYDNLSKLSLPYAEAVFDIDYFRDKPKAFYLLAKDIYPGQYKPSKYHFFIKFIELKQMLKRCYTQNIDTLERLTGLADDKIIEAHGSFSGNHCIECMSSMSVQEMSHCIETQKIPYCSTCKKGIVKPDIVFFGEALPEKFWQMWDKDYNDLDLLFVVGTSLQVYPFAGLPLEVDAQKVTRVLINKEKVGDFKDQPRDSDIVVLGDIDEIIMKLVELLDWEQEFVEFIGKYDRLFAEKKLNLQIDKITHDLELGLNLADADLAEGKGPLNEGKGAAANADKKVEAEAAPASASDKALGFEAEVVAEVIAEKIAEKADLKSESTESKPVPLKAESKQKAKSETEIATETEPKSKTETEKVD